MRLHLMNASSPHLLECWYRGPGGTGPAPHPKGPKHTSCVLYQVVITQFGQHVEAAPPGMLTLALAFS